MVLKLWLKKSCKSSARYSVNCENCLILSSFRNSKLLCFLLLMSTTKDLHHGQETLYNHCPEIDYGEPKGSGLILLLPVISIWIEELEEWLSKDSYPAPKPTDLTTNQNFRSHSCNVLVLRVEMALYRGSLAI